MSLSKSLKRVKRDEVVVTAKFQVIPYRDLEEELKAGQDVFIEGLKAQTAHQAAYRIGRRLGFTVKALAARDGDKRGYVFVRETRG